ncbi:MAG: heavy metal sensor histidine kinase [Verrucomicrobiota bacterium]
MFSKSTRPRSIASQLVLLFTPAAACLLFLALAVLYWIVVRHAFEEDNAGLADKFAAVRADLIATGQPDRLSEELGSLRAGEHASYWVRVLDSLGNTVAETPGMRQLLPPANFPEAMSGLSLKTRDYRKENGLFSLVTTTAEAGGQSYVIQVAQDRSADERFRKEFATLLATVLVIGIIASIVLAITVTKRGLRPLQEMTQSLIRTGPTHLQERIAPAGWPRELQPLAIAFDEMLDRLEDSFRRLSQFSADLAHELRTPIANIRGTAEVTLTRDRPIDEYKEVIASTVAECERLSGIVENLLFLARAEAAEGHIQRTTFAGKAAIENIAAIYEAIAEEKRVILNCSGESDVYADPMLFGRAVSNLVENALRFTPPGGTIQISLAADAAQARVSVADNGCGIAPEHLPHVFDRFYRADSSRSSEGAGLGLALVKSIVDLHGGAAAVESEANRNTLVTLTFPKLSKI